MTLKEKFEIPNCPICGGKHTHILLKYKIIKLLKSKHAYKLKDKIIKLLKGNSLRERPRLERITHIFVCPVKNEKFQVSFKLYQESNNKIEIESVGPLSPNNEAIYETGKEILKISLSAPSDFLKFMIIISTGGTTIYLSYLEFVQPENITISLSMKVLSYAPLFFFFFSTLVFILGYFPKFTRFSLDIINDISQAYRQVINKRRKYVNWGKALFLIGFFLAISSIVYFALYKIKMP